jgi:putative transcriptional regulator
VDGVESGSALVAAPGLRDPNFHRTVVLIIEHQPAGTIGVVLNRPSEVAVRDVLPLWSPLATVPRALYVGGPMQQRAALCVAALPAGVDADRTDGMIKVRGSLALVDLDADPDLMAPRLRGLRVFAGYAGWSPGQLAGELAEGAWACVAGQPDDVLSAAAGPELWRRVMGRQTGRLAVLSTAPADPSAN